VYIFLNKHYPLLSHTDNMFDVLFPTSKQDSHLYS